MSVAWTQETFERLYVPGGYTRESLPPGMFRRRADELRDRFALNARSRVLVVGAGLGLTNEALAELGIGSEAVDSSPWIVEQWSSGGVVPFHPVDVRALDLRRVFDLVVVDDLDGGYHDPDETREVAAAAARFGPVVHIFTPAAGDVDPMLCWRSLDEWREIVPGHAWMETP